MKSCSKCQRELKNSIEIECRNCKTVFCEDCMNENKRICNVCYHDLEY